MKIFHYVVASLCFAAVVPALAATKAEKHDHLIITPEEFTWVDGPEGLPKGAKMVVLQGDPSKAGPFALRLKVPANYKIQPHWHPAIEHVTILQGTFHMAGGDKFDESKGKALPPGSFAVMPIKMHHYAWAGDEEVTFQLHGVGPWGITYLNPKDDPRNQKQQ